MKTMRISIVVPAVIVLAFLAVGFSAMHEHRSRKPEPKPEIIKTIKVVEIIDDDYLGRILKYGVIEDTPDFYIIKQWGENFYIHKNPTLAKYSVFTHSYIKLWHDEGRVANGKLIGGDKDD